MVLNDLLTRQNVFTHLVVKSGDKELPKELKVKVMRIRIAYNKAKKAFDSELKEFTEELLTDEFRNLVSKTDRTSEEDDRLKFLSNSMDLDYQEFLIQKGQEEVTPIEDTFTIDEYADILEVNAGIDVQIGNKTIPSMQFMDLVYELFVKENEV